MIILIFFAVMLIVFGFLNFYSANDVTRHWDRFRGATKKQRPRLYVQLYIPGIAAVCIGLLIFYVSRHAGSRTSGGTVAGCGAVAAYWLQRLYIRRITRYIG